MAVPLAARAAVVELGLTLMDWMKRNSVARMTHGVMYLV
jgi:hypothetical protein